MPREPKFKYQLLIVTADKKVYEHFVDSKNAAEQLQKDLVSKPVVVDGAAYSPHTVTRVTVKEMEIL